MSGRVERPRPGARASLRVIPYRRNVNVPMCQFDKVYWPQITSRLLSVRSTLTVAADRLAFADNLERQSVQRKASSQVYLDDITESLNEIASFSFAARNPRMRALDIQSMWKIERERTRLLQQLDERHTYEQLCEHNFQKTAESLSKESMSILAYVRKDLNFVMHESNKTRVDLRHVVSPELVPEQTRFKIHELLLDCRNLLARLEQALLRPLEVTEARLHYGNAALQDCRTYNDVIEQYKQDLKKVWIERPVLIQSKCSQQGVRFGCKEIDPDNLPRGFIPCAGGYYEYQFRDPRQKCVRRVPARYVPFLGNGQKAPKHSVVPLCRNEGCHSLTHKLFVPHSERERYLKCGGKWKCRHDHKCPIAGLAVDII